jgi:hypothetical protein
MIAPGKWKLLESILRPLRKSQSKTVILVVQAMACLAQAASLPIAAFLSQATGCQVDSALTRFYRLLHNPRLDDLLISKQLLSQLLLAPGPLLLALDWTEWHPPWRMLLASVSVGTRAIPVQAAVFSRRQILRSQNTWENNFLKVLCLLLDELGASACFLADRGFRRVSFLQLLLAYLNHTFLVRMQDQVMVETPKFKRLLGKCQLQPGHAVDLRWVRLRQDGAVQVRVIGLWAKGQKEPWWLATNREDSLSFLASLYDRRMSIEEQIRDSKGARFGFQLTWTQIQTPEALARFTLLIGLALLILTAIGHAVASRRPEVRLASKKKGPRLSLFTVGRLFLYSFLQTQSLSQTFLKMNLPPPTLRSFLWLEQIKRGEKLK